MVFETDSFVAPTICEACDCHVFHQYVIRITNGKRDGLLAHLQSKDIPCAIYYPIPLHSQKAYADSRYKEEDFPVTNQLCKEVIALPMHTELDDEQIKFITDSVLEFDTKFYYRKISANYLPHYLFFKKSGLKDELIKEGISVEIIDLRTVRPLDHDTIIESVKKTNRLVILEEAWPFGSVSTEITYRIQDEAFDYLDAPIKRITTADTPAPYSPVLLEAWIPNSKDVIKAVKEVLKK